MKTQTTLNKLMNRFDNELKSILMNDLSSVRNNHALVIAKIQNTMQSRLKAA